jgi:hypothetical protein
MINHTSKCYRGPKFIENEEDKDCNEKLFLGPNPVGLNISRLIQLCEEGT